MTAPTSHCQSGISKIKEKYGASASTMLYPQTLGSVLCHGRHFIEEYYSDNNRQPVRHFRLDVNSMLAAVDCSACPAGHRPLLMWPGDRAPSCFTPTPQPCRKLLYDFQDPAAQPRMPGTHAGTGSLVPAPLQALPQSDPMQQQHNGQGQHATPAYELWLQQQDDGRYVPSLAQHISTHFKHEASTAFYSAGMQAGMCSLGVQDSSSSLDDVNGLLELLPMDARLRAALEPYTTPGCQPYLVDLEAHATRNIHLHLSNNTCVELPLGLDLDAALQRLEHACCNKSGQPSNSNSSSSSNSGRQAPFFSDHNQLGVPGCLHRISAFRNRSGAVFGLTYRVGRHVPGVADLLADVLSIMRMMLHSWAGLAHACSSQRHGQQQLQQQQGWL